MDYVCNVSSEEQPMPMPSLDGKEVESSIFNEDWKEGDNIPLPMPEMRFEKD